VEESAAFAWGLAGPGEVLAVVRLQRDAMMTQLPLTAIEECLKTRPTPHSKALDHALQSIADIDALSQALQSLDDFTFVTVRWVVCPPPPSLLQLSPPLSLTVQTLNDFSSV